MFGQKDTLMIQHHVDMSQLNCCNCGDALIQPGHSNVWLSIRANHAVLKVQLILITRHRELWTKTTQAQINLRGGISDYTTQSFETEKEMAQLLCSAGHSKWRQWLNQHFYFIFKVDNWCLRWESDLWSSPVLSSGLCIGWKFPPTSRHHVQGSAGCSLKSAASPPRHPHPVAQIP